MNLFQTLLEEKGISLSPQQSQQFHTYYETLIEWNDKINLTAITNKEEVFVKHFYDSLSVSFSVDLNNQYSVCDVGAGAGFPTIPLKICFPHLQITIVDALKKRVGFLETLKTKLQLTDVAFYHDRAEVFGRKKYFRESFDIVTARAVAKLSVLSEYCLPLSREGGVFLAMKGANAESELKEANRALTRLGGEVEQVKSLTLPNEESQRYLIRIKKKGKTPNAYPRKPGTPAKKPLS